MTTVTRRKFEVTDEDRRATALLEALAELPPGHPDRPAVRRQAIEAWLPMAARLTRRYAGRGEAYDDLFQTASVGLIKAIDGFDPGRGVDFTGYAIPTVLGEIKRYFRDRSWTLRIPRRLQELRMAIGGARTELEQTLTRAATVADISAHLGVSEEEVLEALEAGHAYRPDSLSTPVRQGEDLQLGDTLGGEDNGFARAEFGVSLPPAMATLTERERTIVVLRFYGELTQSAIAERVGISQMHVSRVLSQALAKLRDQMDG
ncbi:SigB/SigF/SigG family RNA polymerase sigma factor [Actinoplanes sp. LDG1-06]|uniref:SigB/SigF/SigG family RNA polymerase sigma factor n=1 Tax=Paractinoplanes ovalisporus TaxID=2810368 RepID=A0ABS2A7N5_9ACTN|nr:SigB/SigF/SigG family RNA polymerase sigma factor [Actinoplanes ovalisporus]MBM2615849.1 SigB/SigF/SigG family RNA polymerase sigma factor [Actinoplanes ovalisporus]